MKDESELKALEQVLKDAGIKHHTIIECDGQAMAIGIFPTDRRPLKKYLSKYPLLK